jgi:hypothetical protein
MPCDLIVCPGCGLPVPGPPAGPRCCPLCLTLIEHVCSDHATEGEDVGHHDTQEHA